MEDDKKISVKQKTPENLIRYNPDKPLYERRHLCIYLRELLDEAEKESEEINHEKQQ
ncbi:MAG: hypothetical protein NT178_04160 [Proteobacteria bacterium]|nr:hypothetical protein [Pseudomonadota bacterium]